MLVKQIRKSDKNLKILREMDSICFPEDRCALFGLRKVFCWFLYSENGEIAGYCSGYKLKQYFYLSRCGIMPKYRGKGMQKKLIQERIEKAKDLNLAGLVTYTNNENIASIKNLQSFGFEEWKDSPKWFSKKKYNTFIEWRLLF